MNVTLICDVLGEPNNGTALAAYNLISQLQASGHRVTVVAPDVPGEEGFVSVPAANLGRFLNSILYRNGVQLSKPDRAILEEAIRPADVVHLLIPLPLSMVAVRIAREMNKPVTASFHCQAENVTAHLGLMDLPFVNHLIYKVFYQWVYRYCDCIHYPTEFIRNVFESHTRPTNGYVISNGVNDMFVPPTVRPANEKFTIVCSGRLSQEKAQHQLIQAVALSPYRDAIRILFAGDGPKRQSLIALAEKYGLDCSFRFYSRRELLRVLQSADLYVHTAVVEIEAIACMEAICCGLVPVICNSPRSATRFFAMGDQMLFCQYDAADLANKIDYWIEHPQEKERCAAEFAVWRNRFQQKRCMEQMEQMLCEAVNKHATDILLQGSAQ